MWQRKLEPVGEGDIVGPDVKLEPFLAHNAAEDSTRVNTWSLLTINVLLILQVRDIIFLCGKNI